MLGQEKRLQFNQTRSNAVILYDTLPAECIEKAICMEITETLHEKDSERPRVVLRVNSQCGLQDLPTQKARSSWETQTDAQSFWETGCNIVNYRIPGISISTVQEQDEQRRHKVFESHEHKDQVLKDMSQTKKINRFSEASQELLKDMNHTEIFELCENSKKLQCPGCNSFTDSGIIFCSCGKKLKHGRSVTQFQKNNPRSQFDRWLRHLQKFWSRTKAWSI